MNIRPRNQVSFSRPTRLFAIILLAAFACGGKAETVVWQDNFDDGNVNARWYADNGTWVAGSPTVGPQLNAEGFRTYSSSNCVTTGLSGNYLPNQDTRWIRVASFTVPETNAYPRLRFWHWFHFGAAYLQSGWATGVVEIKPVGASTWTAISPTYSGYGSGVWTRPWLDLRQFAGQEVQVAFHFSSGSWADLGWYVDDLALVTGDPVAHNPEGFELGLADWYAEQGTWEVGVPTSGPGAAHSGTNCAATVLAGNYERFVDSRLISPPFTVPGTNQNPRLRFWHWFHFYAAYLQSGWATGVVEIRPAGASTWTPISPTYEGYGSGVWTRPALDLRQYAGQEVQVAFRFGSIPYPDVPVDSGWYVDDVEIVTGPVLLNNPEGFELGLGDWHAEKGTWEVGAPTSGPGAAHTGTNCAATVLAGDYQHFVDSRLISPPFTVPPASSSPALRFWHWHRFAAEATGVVEIKPVGSNTWTEISLSYSGNSSGWVNPYIPLSSYATLPVQVAFHFSAGPYSDTPVDVGWYVDDISFPTPPPSQPPSVVIQPQDQVSCLGHSATFTVSAAGDPILSYQWYFNTNTLLINATNASLTLTNLQGTNAGNYSVVVSNLGGSTNSAMAQLILYDPYTEIEVEWYFDIYMGAGLYVAGQPGATYILKYASDLRNANWATWTPLATNTLGSSGWWFFLDEESPYSPMRFYQVRRKP
jgi:hypothetical protein